MTDQPRPQVGIALGAGGLKGAAHVGVLQFLTEKNFPIDIIGGCSAGSVIAMLYGLGWRPDQMGNFADKLERCRPFDFVSWFPAVPLMGLKVLLDYLSIPTRWMPRIPTGIIRGRNFHRILTRLSQGSGFAELLLPTVIPAVDLYSGQEVIFCSPATGAKILPKLEDHATVVTTADVALAVRASSSIPGVFEPVHWGPYALVDGAVRNSVPADLVRLAGANFVIAVDLGESLQQTPEGVDNILEVIQQSVGIMGHELSRLRLNQYANFVIKPVTKGAKLNEFDKIPHLIEQGYLAAEKAWPQIYRMYQQHIRMWKMHSEGMS